MAMFETRRVGRRDSGLGLFVAAIVAMITWSGWTAAHEPRGTTPRESLAEAKPADVTVLATLAEPRLVATRALTDYGLAAGARYVAVRILAEAVFEVRIRAEDDLALAGYPRLCLIGPFSMPDYAGLSEPCWGEPDLSALLRPRLPVDATGRPVLPEDREIVLRAPLVRDADRCDYPPGEWRLEVEIQALGEDGAARPLELAPVRLTLPSDTAEPLRLVRPTHYCGIANVVYREQGEPELLPN